MTSPATCPNCGRRCPTYWHDYITTGYFRCPCLAEVTPIQKALQAAIRENVVIQRAMDYPATRGRKPETEVPTGGKLEAKMNAVIAKALLKRNGAV